MFFCQDCRREYDRFDEYVAHKHPATTTDRCPSCAGLLHTNRLTAVFWRAACTNCGRLSHWTADGWKPGPLWLPYALLAGWVLFFWLLAVLVDGGWA